MYPNRPHLQDEAEPGLIDTHCHLDCDLLRPHLPDLLSSARKAGVTGWVVPGVHPTDWTRMAETAREHSGVQCAFGIHPMHADLADEHTLSQLAGIAASGIAVGEIGLDPHYPIPLEIQEMAFRAQLRVAVSLKLPVLIHCRRSFQHTLQVLAEEGAQRVGGIMHAFSGSLEMAREFIRLGFAISISGTVTWRNAVRPVRLARQIPLEWMVFETDAPDMTPQCFRGEFNRPEWMRETVVVVAEMRDMLVADLIGITVTNTRRILPRLQLL